MKEENKLFENSVLNKSVSCFRNYHTPDNPEEVNLLPWLYSEKYKNKIEQIRSISSKAERNKLKSQLPAITPGGLFSYRSTEGLIKPTDLLQVDIDFEENSKLGGFHHLKKLISLIPYVAYCGLSVSGTGYWLLIHIQDSNQYKRHFYSLAKEWKETVGIKFDPARKDIAGLRGCSYDPEAYINHNAEPYCSLYDYSKQNMIDINKGGIGNGETLMPQPDVFSFAMDRTIALGHAFVDGGKHDFLFHLCCILNTYGVTQVEAEKWINDNLILLTLIRSNCVSDVYQRYKNDFGSRKFIPKKNIQSEIHSFTTSPPIEEKITFQYLDKILLFLMNNPNKVIHTNQVSEPKKFIEGCKKLIDWGIAHFYKIDLTFSDDYKRMKIRNIA